MLLNFCRRTPIPADAIGLCGAVGSAARVWQKSSAAVAGLGWAPWLPPPGSLRARVGRCGSTPSSTAPLSNAIRYVSHVTNAANFEAEVLQSQQAICLIYYISNSNCSAYVAVAEKLVDAMNAQTAGLEASASTSTSGGGPAKAVSPARTAEVKSPPVSEAVNGGAPSLASSLVSAAALTEMPKKMEWLKLCTINADENRNLASAFSVQRAKLPITYFVLQGTIVDRVVGHISEARLSAILIRFLEHYQKEMNVDLLARQNTLSEARGTSVNPLPSAATADLLSGTSTTFLQDKIMNALVGADMIRLPEEAEKLDGLRRTLQEAKKKAHSELQELHKQLGMDRRRLTDCEMQTRYFDAPQFHALGVLCALEALYLARSHATLGDVARINVDWARHAVQRDFEAIQGDPALRRVLALVDANLVRAELRTAALLAAQDAKRLGCILIEANTDDARSVQRRDALKEMEALIADERQYCEDMLSIIDAHIDIRAPNSSAFPSVVADQLLELLRSNLKLSRARVSQSAGAGESLVPDPGSTEMMLKDTMDGKALDMTAKRAQIAQTRVLQARTLTTCLLQLYATDPRSHDARSRLASLMY
ncbi:hypothetical protein LSCM1_04142 [Leishmania martiniquensis]|uniref:Uncharacterized protein n=1 Tax=Leishmania martiniquensis TaxID=1580590 RepID=A0A836KKL8_9TRYP|nr:hypothetical protein LSCM1_04142 [Leishmania martiniquensis]